MTYQIFKCAKGDMNYPKAFSNLKGMPDLLYYKGDISLLNTYNSVAIVGSRECSDKSLSFSSEAGETAAKMGLVVVNGLALGCDTAAIVGALRCGGKCVAILPGGLNNIVPKSNENLAKRILDAGGCLISEYAPNVPPKKYTYVQRDKLQSAVSQGVLVVETKIDGGTMHTAEAAIKQRRKIAAYAAELERKSGNKYLLDSGNLPITDLNGLKDYYISLGKDMEWEQLSFL